MCGEEEAISHPVRRASHARPMIGFSGAGGLMALIGQIHHLVCSYSRDRVPDTSFLLVWGRGRVVSSIHVQVEEGSPATWLHHHGSSMITSQHFT